MQNKRNQVRRVLVITLLLNIVVAVSKIALGFVTGALAITADGFHSLVDSSGNVVGLIANVLAERPPDADHPYGHRRFETIAALSIGGLLLLTAWEIGQGAIERLQGEALPEITLLAFGVMLATLVVNLFVNRYELREGKRLKSQILIADAAHTGADVYVTISVLVSMVLVALGWGWADTVVALVVVLLIARAAWHIVRQTGSVLVDTAPFDPAELRALVEDIPAVQDILRVRSRGPVDAASIDIDVQVAPEMTADQTASITAAIRERLSQNLSGIAEIEVHFAPDYSGERDHALIARACADALGLSTHGVRLIEASGDKVLELHVEVPRGQTLDTAHDQVSQLEHEIQTRLPDVVEVVTHIEPSQTNGDNSQIDLSLRQTRSLEEQARRLLQSNYQNVGWHHLSVRSYLDGFALTTHAELPPRITIESAHAIAESAETLLRTDIPQLSRVTIHTEPFDH